MAQIKKHQALFAREEKEFGVPASVITAFWALESDFGAGQGKDNAIKSLATLAYDCRRSEMFRGHLLDALRLIERGDLRPDEMIGSWAGELGQTQLMPSEYMAHAIDYDGDGRRNLIKSAADVIGSTGKYLVHLGWKRGEPWLQEVRVPPNLPWKEADLAVQHPRSQWAAWGVTRADGKPLQADNMPASIVLPVGRFGPAFLAYDNFQAYLKWNQSLNYSLTAAYYSTRIDGAPPMNKGSGNIPKISFEETRELQQILEKRGYDVGRVDGVLGLKEPCCHPGHAAQVRPSGRRLAYDRAARPAARPTIDCHRDTLVTRTCPGQLRLGERIGCSPSRPQALGGELCARDQRSELRPYDARMDFLRARERGKAAIGAGDHVLAADELANRPMRWAIALRDARPERSRHG